MFVPAHRVLLGVLGRAAGRGEIRAELVTDLIALGLGGLAGPVAQPVELARGHRRETPRGRVPAGTLQRDGEMKRSVTCHGSPHFPGVSGTTTGTATGKRSPDTGTSIRSWRLVKACAALGKSRHGSAPTRQHGLHES
ncbi:hypothetical protein [Frankia sp. CiP1_Cm_nod1]|uniref:hypothetical protein n=1 Tax=Frankia sp. CiP1_Cm_nod1 TaxID=2897160 RepID=UPI0020258019